MKKTVLLLSMSILFAVSGCIPALVQVEPTITPSPTNTPSATPVPTNTNTPSATPVPTRTPLPTIPPLVLQLKPGEAVLHPSTETDPYAFYSYFPKSAVREKNIVVGVWPEGGSRDDSDYEYCIERAKQATVWLSDYSEKYKMPIVVVAIPGPLYVQTLHPDVFSTPDEMQSRPDLKLIDAVWNQYIPALEGAGFVTNDKILMMGMSAPGVFTHRFAMLHPELIQAAWECGEAAAPLPASELNGTQLDYPLGIKNLVELAGNPFNLEAYLEVPQMVCVGENEDAIEANWPELFLDGQWQFIKTYFGDTDAERTKFFYDYLISMGAPAEFRLYEGVGHQLTDAMMNDAFEFLISHDRR